MVDMFLCASIDPTLSFREAQEEASWPWMFHHKHVNPNMGSWRNHRSKSIRQQWNTRGERDCHGRLTQVVFDYWTANYLSCCGWVEYLVLLLPSETKGPDCCSTAEIRVGEKGGRFVSEICREVSKTSERHGFILNDFCFGDNSFGRKGANVSLFIPSPTVCVVIYYRDEINNTSGVFIVKYLETKV